MSIISQQNGEKKLLLGAKCSTIARCYPQKLKHLACTVFQGSNFSSLSPRSISITSARVVALVCFFLTTTSLLLIADSLAELFCWLCLAKPNFPPPPSSSSSSPHRKRREGYFKVTHKIQSWRSSWSALRRRGVEKTVSETSFIEVLQCPVYFI